MRKYILSLTVLGSLLIRLYRGPELFFWNIDEDIVGLTVRRMLISHHPQLIGFPIPGGIYLGPLYYYFISVFYLVAGFNPLKLNFFAALFGALTTFLIYKVGSVIFEKRSVGIIASVIFAFSYFANVYSRVFSGLTLAPILSVLTYLILFQNLKSKIPKNLFLLGVVLLFAIQNEGSSLSLLALSFVIWLIYRFKVPISKLWQIIALFVIFHIPLLIFDLRHNFFISKSFLSFLSKKSLGVNSSFSFKSIVDALGIFPSTLSRILYPSGNFHTSSQILPCTDLVTERLNSVQALPFLIAVLILTFFILSMIFKKKKAFGEKIVMVHLAIALFGVLLFNFFVPGYLFEWILIVFLPAFCFITAYCASYLYEKGKIFKIVIIFSLAVFIFVNVRATLKSTDNFGLLAKSNAVKLALQKVGNREFNFESIGSCYQSGYMYLFWRNGRFPKTSWADDTFSPTFYQRNLTKPSTTVVIASPSEKESQQYFEKYNIYKSQAIFSERAGEIEILILEDTK